VGLLLLSLDELTGGPGGKSSQVNIIPSAFLRDMGGEA